MNFNCIGGFGTEQCNPKDCPNVEACKKLSTAETKLEWLPNANVKGEADMFIAMLLMLKLTERNRKDLFGQLLEKFRDGIVREYGSVHMAREVFNVNPQPSNEWVNRQVDALLESS